MTYYAVAMAVTLLLCYSMTTVYSLPGRAEARCFRNAKIAFLVLLPLTLVQVLRWDVGVDSLYEGSYWQAYHASVNDSNPKNFEVGFYLLMSVFAKLEVPYYWFLFALGVAFMTLTAYAISRGSVWTQWSILVFFLLAVYFDSFSSLRQSLAEAISLIGWAYMGYAPPSRRKHFRIIAMFLFAGLFHSISWMNIPVYLLCCVRFNRVTLLRMIIAAVLLSPVLSAVLRVVMTLVAGNEYSYMGVAWINAIMSGAMAIVCWYFYDEISSLDENAYMYVNQSVGIFILIMNSGAMFLPFRVFDMLKIGYVFITPYLLRGIREKRLRLSVSLGVLAVFGAWFVNFFFLQKCFAADYQTALDDWSNIIKLP
ncbi:MAG: EpsG family protein [Ruminococcaceae bacterium]|nr:EpsG family protein [Oscillospiraceae bacterium]